MKTLGKDCTLTAAKDNLYFPLPYCEETIRVESQGFSLPCVIGQRNRDVNINLGKTILGCFVTRLEYSNIYFLFSLLFLYDDDFDLFISHVVSKSVYKNLNVKSFELRAGNKNPFYLRIDVKESSNSFVDTWAATVPELSWDSVPTYRFDGNNVICDYVTQPLIYRFELNGDFTKTRKYSITLFFALNEKQDCTFKPIKKILIPVSVFDGIYLELNDLEPVDNLVDVNTADEILVHHKYIIKGNISLIIRNASENKVVTI